MRQVLVVGLLSVSLLCGALSARAQSTAPDESTTELLEQRRQLAEEREALRLFADSLAHIKSRYVKDDLTDRQLIEAAIRGMMSQLDPHSAYIAPEDLQRFRTGLESEFGGIGITVVERDGQLQVISPIFGAPAHRAGVLAGDILVAINGEDATKFSMDDAVQRVQGEIGTTLSLTVMHAHDQSRETFELTRELVHLESVLGYARHEDGQWNYWCDEDRQIAYVRLTAFSRPTADELTEVLHELQEQQLQALVLDLRFNPGGLLESAVEICDLFLADGTIVSTQGREGVERTWTAEAAGTLEDFPIAVLVNGYSASASEIVAACLQDHDRATIVGQQTWGKGSVQNVIELEQGRSAIKLTTAGYLRPSGRSIHRFPDAKDDDPWGVVPNDGFTVRLSLSDTTALNEAQQRRAVVGWQPQLEDPQAPEAVDRQLEKALAVLREALSAHEALKE